MQRLPPLEALLRSAGSRIGLGASRGSISNVSFTVSRVGARHATKERQRQYKQLADRCPLQDEWDDCLPREREGDEAPLDTIMSTADLGVDIGGPITVDMKRVKARKDEIVAKGRNGVMRWMERLPNGTVYRGHACFERPRSVRIGSDLLTADRIFISTRGRALVPEITGLAEVDYLTNSSMLELEVLPEHLIIVGGSYIGLEFAPAHRRFSSKVTIIELGERLIPRETPTCRMPSARSWNTRASRSN